MSTTTSPPDVTLAEHFNGTSWSVVRTPTLFASGSQLTGVAAVASNDVWAVGLTGSQTLIEHWDGTSFKVVTSPDPFPNGTTSLQGVAAVSATDIYAVGFAAEQWNGTSWSIVTTPSGVSGMDDVTALSDGTVVIVSSIGAILEN